MCEPHTPTYEIRAISEHAEYQSAVTTEMTKTNTRLVSEETKTRSGVWVGGQPSEFLLRDLIINKGVTLVIRLNGEGEDAGKMDLTTENSIVTGLGAKFQPYNIEGDRMAAKIASIVEEMGHAEGNVLVHCRHGVHRSGAVSIAWLLEHGTSKEVAYDRVGWDEDRLNAWHKPYAAAVDGWPRPAARER